MSPRAGHSSPGRDAVLAAVRALWDERQQGASRAEIRDRVNEGHRPGTGLTDWNVRSHLLALAAEGSVRPPQQRRGGYCPSLDYCLRRTG